MNFNRQGGERERRSRCAHSTRDAIETRNKTRAGTEHRCVKALPPVGGFRLRTNLASLDAGAVPVLSNLDRRNARETRRKSDDRKGRRWEARRSRARGRARPLGLMLKKQSASRDGRKRAENENAGNIRPVIATPVASLGSRNESPQNKNWHRTTPRRPTRTDESA